MEKFISLQANKNYRNELLNMNSHIINSGSFWYLHPIFSNYWKFNQKCSSWFDSNKKMLFPFIHMPPIEDIKIENSTKIINNKKKKKMTKKLKKKSSNSKNPSNLPNKKEGKKLKVDLKSEEKYNALSHRQRISIEPTLDFNSQYFNKSNSDSALELAIDDTWLEYTKIHQLHAKEREIHKNRVSEKIENYKKENRKLEFPEPDFVDAKDINHHHTNFTPSSQTPRYKPNELREGQLISLYGEKNAVSIAFMETALQNTFEEICQKNNPTLWPIIPFNL